MSLNSIHKDDTFVIKCIKLLSAFSFRSFLLSFWFFIYFFFYSFAFSPLRCWEANGWCLQQKNLHSLVITILRSGKNGGSIMTWICLMERWAQHFIPMIFRLFIFTHNQLRVHKWPLVFFPFSMPTNKREMSSAETIDRERERNSGKEVKFSFDS